ncbi:MAG: hypothetical protein J6B12_02485 [Clostridia bacterium]|nr:hypothetical protein [Clostridia bacterium]
MTKDIVFSAKNLSTLLIDRKPCAKASLLGGESVRGSVYLYATPIGVLVKANFGGLPKDERTRGYRVLFAGKHRPTMLSCATDGACQCLTAAFSVEDVLGGRVALLSDDGDSPLATGELRSVGF